MNTTNITITPDELMLLHRLKRVVFKRSKTVDPDDSCDWHDLVYGFFLGAGLTPKRSQHFARLVHSYNNWLDQIPPLPKRKDPKGHPGPWGRPNGWFPS